MQRKEKDNAREAGEATLTPPPLPPQLCRSTYPLPLTVPYIYCHPYSHKPIDGYINILVLTQAHRWIRRWTQAPCPRWGGRRWARGGDRPG